ncbi:MAG: hypothetical protein ACKV2V_13330, partial [Blastocatellia bacterium]
CRTGSPGDGEAGSDSRLFLNPDEFPRRRQKDKVTSRVCVLLTILILAVSGEMICNTYVITPDKWN